MKLGDLVYLGEIVGTITHIGRSGWVITSDSPFTQRDGAWIPPEVFYGADETPAVAGWKLIAREIENSGVLRRGSLVARGNYKGTISHMTESGWVVVYDRPYREPRSLSACQKGYFQKPLAWQFENCDFMNAKTPEAKKWTLLEGV